MAAPNMLPRLLLLLLLLVAVAPPFSSAGIPRASPQLGRFVAKGVRSIIKKSAKEYLQDKAQQGVKDFSGGGGGNGHQLGSSAANTLGTFVFDLSVGTSASGAPQTLQFVMDITSELVWARCGYGGPTRTFLPANSVSFLPIGCDDQVCKELFPDETCTDPTDNCGYKESLYRGGETSTTNGYLAWETFTFGTSPVTSMVFGCSDTVPDLDGASGFAGFSRGGLSLVSQLQVSWFSYFIALPNDPNNQESFVSWGDATVAPDKGKSSRHTPLLAPTANQNSYRYYVKLTGVQVDGQLLTDIPADTFDVQNDGSGGVFLSTTLPVTYLDQAAYKVLRRELLSRVQSEGVSPTNPDDENHLCFPTQPFHNAEVPRLALVFDGADAVMELDGANYFFDLDSDRTCLTILPSIGGSVLGSLLQTGRTMTYEIHDNGGGVLSFETFETAAGASAPAAGSPTPAKVPLMIMATLLLWVLL